MIYRRMLRFEVPVDGEEHVLAVHPAQIKHIATRHANVVEFWALEDDNPYSHTFLVVGTGHRFGPVWNHLGTAIVPGGALVWHLLVRQS